MKKYKLNKKKVIRNIIIIALTILIIANIILITKFFKMIGQQQKHSMKQYDSYIEFVKENNLELTEQTYKEYLNK